MDELQILHSVILVILAIMHSLTSSIWAALSSVAPLERNDLG